MKTWILAGCLIVAAGWGGKAFAQSTIGQEDGLEYLLFQDIPMIELASKKEETLLEAPGTVYVITDKEIQAYGWNDLNEILNSVANIELSKTYEWTQGGHRGFAGSFTGSLLLVDGHIMNELWNGESQIRYGKFPAHMIKRVEILQGTASTLYGSAAMEGAINIVTKIADKSVGDTGIAEIRAGDAGTKNVGGSFKKVFEEGSFGFTGNHYVSDRDWDETVNWYMQNVPNNGVLVTNRDQFKGNVDSWESRAHFKYKGLYGGHYYEDNLKTYEISWSSKFVQRKHNIGFVGFQHELNDKLKLKFELERNDNDLWSVDATGAQEFWSYQNKYNGELQYFVEEGLASESHYLIMGAETYDREVEWRFTENSAFPVKGDVQDWWANGILDPGFDQTDQKSIFIQDKIEMMEKKLALTLGVRYDKEKFTDAAHPIRTSLVYLPTANQAIKLLFGQGFRAPSIWELIGTAVEEVEPHTMDMVELNHSFDLTWGDWQVSNVFSIYNMESTIITSQLIPGSDENLVTSWEAVKKDLAVLGLEDQLKFQLNKFSGFFGFRWAEPDDTNVGGEGIAQGVPKTKIKLGMSYLVNDWIQASLFTDTWSKIDYGNTQVKSSSGFTIADVNLNIRPTKLFVISLAVNNVFDNEYFHVHNQTQQEYIQPPRNYSVKVSMEY